MISSGGVKLLGVKKIELHIFRPILPLEYGYFLQVELQASHQKDQHIHFTLEKWFDHRTVTDHISNRRLNFMLGKC